MSRPPSAASAFVAIPSTPSLVVTSPETNVAAAGVSSLRVRAATTTLAPASRRRCAMAAPMPRDPPVTRARWPMSSFERSSLLDMRCSSRLLLEQVLEDQRPPALVPRVHKRATLFELPEIDGCETELFGEGRHQRCGTFIVAREEHDPPAAPDVWIGGQGSRGEMIEALHDAGTGEGVGDDLGRRLTSEFLRGHAVGIGHID